MRHLAAHPLVLLVLSCGGSLLTVPSGPPPPDAARVRVEYPPPPAKVEEISVGHGGGPCAWRDGFWDWSGRRWEWQPGRAVRPVAGCYHSRPALERSADTLTFLRPAWYPQAGGPKSCAEVACTAAPGTMVN
ncbi:MAG TPA: hypothetical protein VGI10_19555 [Polyangiaceae bacterium]|jgi:hypothetical protein